MALGEHQEFYARWYRMRMRRWWKAWRLPVWIAAAVFFLAASTEIILFLRLMKLSSYSQPPIYFSAWISAVAGLLLYLSLPVSFWVAVSQVRYLQFPVDIASILSAREIWRFQVQTVRRRVLYSIFTVGLGMVLSLIFISSIRSFFLVLPQLNTSRNAGPIGPLIIKYGIVGFAELLLAIGGLACLLEWFIALLCRISPRRTSHWLLAAPLFCLLASAISLGLSDYAVPAFMNIKQAWDTPLISALIVIGFFSGLLFARELWLWASGSAAHGRWAALSGIAIAAAALPMWSNFADLPFLWPVGALARGLYLGNIWAGNGAGEIYATSPFSATDWSQYLNFEQARLADLGMIIGPYLYIPWYFALVWLAAYYGYSWWVIHSAAVRMPRDYRGVWDQ